MTRRKDDDPSVLGINRRNLDFVFHEHRPGRFRDLDDKVRTKSRLERVGVLVPPTVGIIETAAQLTQLQEWLSHYREIVIKPVHGWGGRGVLVLERSGAEGNWRSPGGRDLGPHEIEDHILAILSGAFSLDESADQALLEERIHPHAFLAEIYPRGLSDLRIIVDDGVPLQAMLRVPTDASEGRANLHEGGVGLGVDIESGSIVHAMQSSRPIERHPDTGVELLGRSVPEWASCLEQALATARAFSEIRYLGIDVVLDAKRGPMVLEVNARPGLAIQLANQQAQPVRRPSLLSPFDRWTQRAAWAILALMVILPILFSRWQDRSHEEIRDVHARGSTKLPRAETEVDESSYEWSDEGTPISDQDTRFADAKFAAASGDTARALELYAAAAMDSALAPFALNNIALIHRARGDLAQAQQTLEEAIVRFPEYARGEYNLGLVLRDRGQADAAEAAFRRALEIRPSHARSWGELGELLLAAGRWQEAIDALGQAVRFDPDAVGDRRRLGYALLSMGQPDEALANLEGALSLDPDNARSILGWARVVLDRAALMRRAPSAAMLDSMERRVDPLAKRRSADPSRARLLAQIQWCAGHSVQARETLEGLSGEDRDADVLLLLAMVALDDGRWADARSIEAARPELVEYSRVGTALENPGSNVPALRDPIAQLIFRVATGAPIAAELRDAALALAVDEAETRWLQELLAGRVPTVETALPTSLRLRAAWDAERVPLPASLALFVATRLGASQGAWSAIHAETPNFLPMLRLRFANAVAAHDLDAAHENGLTLLEMEAHDVETLLQLAGVELDRGDRSLPRSLFERVPAEERTRPDARRLEARILMFEGEHAMARTKLESLAADQPLDSDLLSELAETQRAMGKFALSAKTLERAIDLAPERSDLRIQRARSLMQLRKYEEALSEWNRMISMGLQGSELRSMFFNRALTLQRLDRFDEAITQWQAYLQLVPDNPRAVFNLALALEDSGRRAEAIAQYRRVLELDPTHAASRTHLDSLEAESSP